jgi:hypothetical protein
MIPLSRKTEISKFDQTLTTLRAHSFEIAPWPEIDYGVLVTKHGAGAVLVADPAKRDAVNLAVAPGAVIQGRVARLVDRGYQKFLKTSKFELPATADQLHSIHLFTEELRQLTGGAVLFNEALGTTSDVYLYDRLKNREAAPAA